MPRRIQTSYTKGPAYIAAIGDSHTLNYAYEVRQSEYYPDRLAVALTANTGRLVEARNWGISGDTTRASTTGGTWSSATYGMLERIAAMTRYETPVVGIIYASTNDFSCIAAGGAMAADQAATTATVSSLITLPSVESMIDALYQADVTRIVVCGYHVRNWASGGDVTAGAIDTEASLTVDPGAVFGASSRWANYQAYLTKFAEYTSASLAWCDLYAAFKTRLELPANSSQIGNDTFLHVAASNTHLNATGQQWIADAIAETIAAKDGWEDAIADA